MFAFYALKHREELMTGFVTLNLCAIATCVKNKGPIRPRTTKDYKKKNTVAQFARILQELCESRGGRPGPVRPNEPSGFRGRKAILNHASALVTACP